MPERGEGVPASRRVGFGAQPRLGEGAHVRATAAAARGEGVPASRRVGFGA